MLETFQSWIFIIILSHKELILLKSYYTFHLVNCFFFICSTYRWMPALIFLYACYHTVALIYITLTMVTTLPLIVKVSIQDCYSLFCRKLFHISYRTRKHTLGTSLCRIFLFQIVLPICVASYPSILSFGKQSY